MNNSVVMKIIFVCNKLGRLKLVVIYFLLPNLLAKIEKEPQNSYGRYGNEKRRDRDLLTWKFLRIEMKRKMEIKKIKFFKSRKQLKNSFTPQDT